MSLKCTMILGDCLDVMRTLPKATIDMTFADWPYAATGFEWDREIDQVVAGVQLVRTMRYNGPIVATANERFLFKLKDTWGERLRYVLVWQKLFATGAFHAHRRPMVSHEYIAVIGDTKTYNPQKTTGHKPVKKTGERLVGDFTRGLQPLRQGKRLDLDHTRHPGSVLVFAKDRRVRRSKSNGFGHSTHPSQKPVALLDWLIRTYSNAGDLVLDPVSGSGTTACAALLSGRNVVCIERNKEHHSASVERVRETAKRNLLDVKIEVIT